MKNLFLSIVLLMSTFSYSQVGVITINEGDFMPIDQWYVLRGEENEDVVYYYNRLEACIDAVNSLLESYTLDFINATIEEDGSMYWSLIHGNGFASSVGLYPDGEDGEIYIDTFEHVTDDSSNK